MVSRGLFYFVTAVLFIAGIILVAYQKITFEVPFTPGEHRQIWTVEAKIEFSAKRNTPLEVMLALPAVSPNFTQLKQNTASLGFGVNYLEKNGTNYVQWTKREGTGGQTLYYRADILKDDTKKSSMIVPSLSQNSEEEPYATAMREISTVALSHSSDAFSYATQIIHELNQSTELTSMLNDTYKRPELLVSILQLGKVPARVVGVLSLKDGRRNQKLKSYVAVFKGTTYEIFNPVSGISGLGSDQMIWTDNGNSLLDVSGGTDATVSFTTIKSSVSAVTAGQLAAGVNVAAGEEMFSFSLDSMPVEEQSMFKGLLLLPIGVLIVVFLRIIVGVKTSGTFMPVLIAMAFLQTSLVLGLVGFVSIVGVGLIVRSWLSHLNLLLVPRISAVIITVIAIIGLTSFFSFKMGLAEGVKITFFPMIIMSWTIERMSILWEEEGYKEVIKQGGGSLFVAVCAYLSMNSIFIQHITFNFLGVQLIILSIVLILGNYTGYRITELKRFKPLASQIKIYKNGDETEHESVRLARELDEINSDPHNTYRTWKQQAQKRIAKDDEQKKDL